MKSRKKTDFLDKLTKLSVKKFYLFAVLAVYLIILISDFTYSMYTFTAMGQETKEINMQIVYTLTFDSNGGSSCTDQTQVRNDAWGTLCAPTRTGYNFNGWYTKKSGGTQVTSSTLATGNTKVYARWTGKPYTVTFNNNGGNNSTTSKTVNYGSQYGTLPTPTKTGYTFEGWKLNDKVISSGSVVTTNSSHTLVAEYRANVVIVTLNKQGGTSSDTTTVATYDSNLSSVEVPTKEGYTFGGYYSSQNGNGTRYFDENGDGIGTSTFTSATEIYAKWTPITYTITYTLNGGTVSGNPTSYTIESNNITLNNPTKTGYTFTGWTGSNGTTPSTSVTIATGSTGNKSYVANFEAKTYLVKYYQGNGTSEAGNTQFETTTTCTYGQNCTLASYATLNVTFPSSTSTLKWSFCGWTDTNSITNDTQNPTKYTNGETINPSNYTETLNLYAVGSRSVTFASGIAPTSLKATEIQYWIPYSNSSTYVTKVAIPQATSLSTYGWTFIGYRCYDTASSTVGIASSLAGTNYKIPPTYAVEFRSIYSREIGVTYNANGGTGSIESQTGTQYYNSGYPSNGTNSGANITSYTFTLASSGITRSGYTLKAWAAGSVSGTQYSTSMEYRPAVNNSSYIKEMFALWKKQAGNLTITLSQSTYTYDGTAKTPTVTVKDGDVTLQEGTDYTISYSNNINSGSATVTITMSNIYNSTTNAYYEGTTTVQFTINKKSLTPTASCSNKTYDGTTTASCTLGATGLVGSETVSITGSCAFGDKNVGTSKTVTCSSLAIASGTYSGNYTLSSTSKTATANITAKSLTPSISSCSNKTYDGTTSASCTISLATPISGDTVSASGTCTFNNKNVGTGKTVTCSSISLSGTDSGNYMLDSTSKTKTANITAKSLTPSVSSCSNKTYDGTTSASCTISLATPISGDTVSASGTCTFNNKNVGTGKTVTCSSISLSGTDSGNYTLDSTSKTKTANITAKAVTITAKNQTITYGNSIATGISQVTVGTLGTGDSLTSITLTPSTSNYTTNGTITPSDAVIKNGSTDNTGNYSITYTAGTLVINKANMATPSVSIDTNGKVTWGNITGATNYQISFDNSNWTTATSGSEYIDLTSSGTKTAYVRAVSTSANYNTPSSAGSKSVAVYQLTLTKGTGISAVSGAGYYVSGKQVSIDATVSSGYTWSTWTKNNGTSPASLTTKATTVTIAANTQLTASATGNLYTINYYQGNGTSTAGNTELGTSECTFGTACTLTTYATLGGTFPESSHGWGFAGWSTSQTSTTRTYTNGGTINPSSYAENVNIYAVGSRSVTFASGLAPTSLLATKTQYWVPYSTSTSYVTAVEIPNPTSLSDYGWTFIGYRYNDTASSTVGIAASNAGTNYKINPTYAVTYRSIYQRTIGVEYNANGGTGSIDGQTGPQYYNSGYPSGGSNSGANTTSYTFTLASSGITRSGYTLKAWAADSISGTKYTSSMEYRPAVNNASYVKEMYALWKKDASNLTVTLSQTSYTYDRSAKTPTVTVKDGDTTLTEGTDYTVSYSNNTNAGTATVTITMSNVYNSTTNAYYEGTTSTTFTISPKSLTPTANCSNKTYNGNTTAVCVINLTGIVYMDDISATGTCTFANKNAGTNKTVTCSSITLDGPDHDNYTLSSTSATGSANITAKSINISNITLSASNKTYNGNTTASCTVTIASSAIVSGDTVTGSTSACTFNNKNVGTGKTVTGTITLGGTDAGNYTLSSTSKTTTANITAKSVTPSLSSCTNKTYDGNTTITGSISLTGKVSGDTVSASGTCAAADKNVGTGKDVSCTGISLSGADAGNYTLSATTASKTGCVNITARSVTPGISGCTNRTYTGNTTVTCSLGVSGIIGYDVDGYVMLDIVAAEGTCSAEDKNVGTGKNVTCNNLTLYGSDAGNYTLSSTTTSKDSAVNITAKSIAASSITLSASNKAYDGNTTASCTVTIASSAIISGDTVTGSTSACTFANSAVGTGKTVTGTITLGGTDAGNYTLASTSKTTTANITAKSVTPTVSCSNKTYNGDTDASCILGASGLVGSETITVTGTCAFANKNVGTGKTVTCSDLAISSGTYSGNYTLNATSKTATANITAKSIAASDITLSASNKTYNGNTTASCTVSIASSAIISGDTVTGSTSACTFNNKNVGTGKTVTGTITLGGTDAGNYTLASTSKTTTANITAKGIDISNVTLSASNKTYNGNTTASCTVTIASSAIISGDTVTGSTSACTFNNKNVGTGKTVTGTITLGGSDGGNYTLSSTTKTATANITAKSIAASDITLSASNKTYNGNTTASCTVSIASSAIISGDTVTGSTSACTFNNKNVGTGKTVTGTITLGGTDGGNYTLSSTSKTTTANITAKSLTPTASCSNKTYDGGTSASCTIGFTGTVSGDTVTGSGTCAFADKNVGTEKTVSCSSITKSGTDAGNYSLSATTASGTANITAKSITITANGQTIVYGGLIATGVEQVTTDTLATGDSLTSITLTPSTSNVTTSGTITPSSAVIKNGSTTNTSNYSISYVTGTLVITKADMDAPNVTIDENGVVSWESVTGATSYQISFDNSSWSTATSGSSSIPLTSSGTKTAYVRAVTTSSNYNTPSGVGSASAEVYQLTLTKGTGISSVSGAGYYVLGKVINIDATVSGGYNWSTWTKNSGTSPASLTTKSTTVAIAANTQLTASATAAVYTISLDNKSANTAGTSVIYEKYNTGYYLESACTTQMTTSANGITVPQKTGYTFEGYYTAASGGTQYINSSGKLTSSASTTNFTSEGTLHAHWTPVTYSISLNNQSATTAGTTQVWYQYKTTGTISGTTCYYYTNSSLSACLTNGYTISKPAKTGFNFGGYYTSTGCSGTQYVNTSGSFINNIYQKVPSEINSSYTTAITLYACWIDAVAPACRLDISGSNVVSASRTDNSGSIAAHGMSTSSTPVYNSTTSLALSANTFYGFVKDPDGNEGMCSKPIGSISNTYTCTKAGTPLYTCTLSNGATANYSGTITCNRYTCASGTLSGSTCTLTNQTSCSSGWNQSTVTGYTCPTVTVNGNTVTPTRSGSTCSYSAYVANYMCTKAANVTSYSGTCYCSQRSDGSGNNIMDYCTMYNPTCSSVCSANSMYLTGGSCQPSAWSCTDNAWLSGGHVCYLYNMSSCPSGWSSSPGYACASGSHTLSGSTCSFTATPLYTCTKAATGNGTATVQCDTAAKYNSPTTQCGTNVYASNTCTRTYTCSTGSPSGANCVQTNQTSCSSGWTQSSVTGYSCSTGQVNGSNCVLYEQSSCSSGWTSTANPSTCPTGARIGSTNYCANDINAVVLNDQTPTTASSPTTIYYRYGTNAYYSNINGTGTAITSITKPTKTGYTYGGHYTATGGSGTQYINAGGTIVNSLYNTNPTNGRTIYAKWTPLSYTLTISQGSGSTITVNRTSSTGGATGVLSDGATIYYGDVLKITITANTGYTIGTHTVNGSAWTSGNNHTVAGNVTVASTATIKSYTVTYSCNGGPGTDPSSVTVNHGSNANISNRPCGYIITPGTSGSIKYQTGWSTSSASGATAMSSVTVTGTTNLYATWGNLFTYAGSYNVISDGSGNWRVKFLTTGSKNLVMNASTSVDIFVVGGGGGGGSSGNSNGNCNYVGGGGGGGGYTKTCSNQTASGTISITVGDGGAGSSTAAVASTGGTSSFGSLCSAAGGVGGGYGGATRRKGGAGGNGGSGGGGGASGYYQNSADGGSNGANGGGNTTSDEDTQGTPGIGCASNNVCKLNTSNCTNTREFCESGGTIYSGGGSGGLGSGSSANSIAIVGTPGSPGGGAGGASHAAGSAGTANTGGGGGGAGSHTGEGYDVYASGGKGGSGIVIMRNHR